MQYHGRFGFGGSGKAGGGRTDIMEDLVELVQLRHFHQVQEDHHIFLVMKDVMR